MFSRSNSSFLKSQLLYRSVTITNFALFTYILFDFYIYHSGYFLKESANSLIAKTSISPKSSSSLSQTIHLTPNECLHREAYYESDDNKRENPWIQMKWMGEPARCKVKGHLIEKLDDINNFRRGFSLRFVNDVEDKTHLFPWFLASKEPLHQTKRRIYLDLGANKFSTSILWFLRMYPCDFTEIHAFEIHRGWPKVPTRGFSEEENWAALTANATRVKRIPGVPRWMLDRIKVYRKLVSHADNEESGAINITRFMKEELKLISEDFVVVKMDIEGDEWPILEAWMQDAEMPDIIDELFVEIHYSHPSMAAYEWDTFKPKMRENAKKLLADLRWKGFYAHFWP